MLQGIFRTKSVDDVLARDRAGGRPAQALARRLPADAARHRRDHRRRHLRHDRHRRGRRRRPPGRRAGADGLVRADGGRLRLHGALLRRVRRRWCRSRGSAYTYSYATLGELVGLDHRLGPDHRVRDRQHRRRHLVGGLLPHAAAQGSASTSRLAGHRLPLRDQARRIAARPSRPDAGHRTPSAGRSARRRRTSSASRSSSTCRRSGSSTLITVRAGARHPRERRLQHRRWCGSSWWSSRSSSSSASSTSSRRTGTPSRPTAARASARGAAIIFFAYIGFDAVSTAAEETKNPKRDMPIGIIGSLIICTIIYVVVAVGLHRHDCPWQAARRRPSR